MPTTTLRAERPSRMPRRRWVALGAGLVLLLAACEGDDAEDPEDVEETDGLDSEAADLDRLEAATALDYAEPGEEGPEPWEQDVPRSEDVEIPSSMDDHQQPARWLPPEHDDAENDDAEGDDGTPLLVVLHSWSVGYEQHQSIPFVQLAEQLGWASIAPDFRGANDDPEAGGSELAVQDVVDAIDWADDQADIDPDRVYVTGYSGGGMITLLVAGQHPDRFAGAAAWVPVYDLVDWYEFNAEHHPEEDYTDEIEVLCGGDPTTDGDAQEECEQRSPTTYTDAIADAQVPVYVGHGLDDDVVRPDMTPRAYNEAADPDAPVDDEVVEALYDNELPDDVAGTIEGATFFDDQDPDVLMARESGPSRMIIFEGEHDMVYHPTMRWLAALDEAR